MKVEHCKKHGDLEKKDEDPTVQLKLVASILTKVIWPGRDI